MCAVLVSTAELGRFRGWWSAIESTSEDEDEGMEHRWNDTGGRRSEHSEKNLLQLHCVHHASPWNWIKF